MVEDELRKEAGHEAALLTPLGKGAIASIGVYGPEAIHVVGRYFQPLSGRALDTHEIGSIVVGHFASSRQSREELVLAMKSPTELEIHCHGGRAAIEAITGVLQREGVRIVSWRQPLTAKPSIESEALAALAEARTQRTAAILLDQYRGALRAALERIVQDLEAGRIESARNELTTLIARADVGLHLTKPWKVVLVGEPNVGKSSLINALLGYERAIVFSEPGTTRDVLAATTAIDGWPVELSDTAGLRESRDQLEGEGMRRTRQQLLDADLVLLLIENNRPWDGQAFEVLPPGKNHIVVYSKSDWEDWNRGLDVDRPSEVCVSALTGEGLPSLCAAISQAFVPILVRRDDAIPFTISQLHTLETAASQLESDHQIAVEQLQSLLDVADFNYGQ